jgi:hypothetical protein
LFRNQYEIWIAYHAILQENSRSDSMMMVEQTTIEAALEADIYRTEEEDILVLHDPPSVERSGARVSRNAAPPQPLSLAPLVAVSAAIAFALFAGMSRYRAISSEPAHSAPTSKALPPCSAG